MKVFSSAEHLQRRVRRITIFLPACLLAVTACSGLAWPRSRQDLGNPPTTAFPRCAANSAQLCLVGFGLDDLGRMVIHLSVPEGTDRDLHVKLEFKGTQVDFPCVAANDSVVDVFCTGTAVPLGSTVSLTLYSAQGSDPLVHGDFLVSSLALPTLSSSGTPPSATASGTTVPVP